MLGLDETQFIALTLALTVGGIVKGVTGIGLPIVSIAILVNFMEPKIVLATIVIPIVITNLWQAVRMGRLFEPLARFWPMAAAFLICLVVTAHFVAGMDTQVLFGVLGISVSIFAMSNLFRPHGKPLKTETEKWAGPLSGALGGILGGVSTIWGPPMMMYFILLRLPKDTFVRVVGMIWTLGAIPLALSYWANGLLNDETAPLSVYACVPGMAGILIGEVIRKKIDQDTFRKVMLVALFIIGLNLIRRAAF